MNIAIIGAGTFGVALSVQLFSNNHTVKMWVHTKEKQIELEKTHVLKTLPNVKIPDSITFDTDYAKVLRTCDVVVIAVASIYVRKCVNELKKYLKDNMIIVCVSKGLEKDTLFTMSMVIKDELKTTNLSNVNVVALAGPTHAEEVSLSLPTTIVSACEEIKVASKIQDIFMNENFRVYTNDDIKGVEICGALKNIYALACGISTGLSYGDNIKAAIITRGILEMSRLGREMECKKDTFYGLSGIGDLIVTATSRHSRNNRCGEYIGQGLSVEDAVKKVGMVVEGVNSITPAVSLMHKYNVNMPILYGVYEIIVNKKDTKTIINDLMIRDKKSE